MPVVTTLHTVLAEPTAVQRNVVNRIVDMSGRVIVMADKAKELLRLVYRVPADKIEVIAHGIPDFPFVEPDQAKAKFGFSGKSVILTFGLLSRKSKDAHEDHSDVVHHVNGVIVSDHIPRHR